MPSCSFITQGANLGRFFIDEKLPAVFLFNGILFKINGIKKICKKVGCFRTGMKDLVVYDR